mmetsp:Transcript_30684/g.99812  ORF Transcript_30684/g.99812 Transcript_30684/m.99812 type:complete len:263 (+) Transcript_30684:910-1698(+)
MSPLAALNSWLYGSDPRRNASTHDASQKRYIESEGSETSTARSLLMSPGLGCCAFGCALQRVEVEGSGGVSPGDIGPRCCSRASFMDWRSARSSGERSRSLWCVPSPSVSQKLCTSRSHWMRSADSGLHMHPGPWMPCGSGGGAGGSDQSMRSNIASSVGKSPSAASESRTAALWAPPKRAQSTYKTSTWCVASVSALRVGLRFPSLPPPSPAGLAPAPKPISRSECCSLAVIPSKTSSSQDSRSAIARFVSSGSKSADNGS